MGAMMNRTITVEDNGTQDFYSNPVYRLPKRSFFRTIPPERVGLNGEYDHSGLAKRVKLKLAQVFGLDQVADLAITQRGRVVILTGKIASPELLDCIVREAIATQGANEVETQGVKFHR